MMVLTANERAFIHKMKENEELARHGFSLLLKRPDFLRFFQPLRDAGLFAPERNPGPEPAPEQGYVRIPYWSALDYLVEIAKQAGTTNDLVLANQVMEIVRTVSQWRETDGQPRQNWAPPHICSNKSGPRPPRDMAQRSIRTHARCSRNR